jgi:excisionase family DNA binding protein
MSNWMALKEELVAEVLQAVITSPIPKRLLSVREAAEYLNCDETTVRNFVAAGKLPAVRITSRVQFDLADLDALINASKR